ncbi:hypothetical protein [Blastococcus colisei]|nr:hypothetical protein [Blastococcus colisei]
MDAPIGAGLLLGAAAMLLADRRRGHPVAGSAPLPLPALLPPGPG